MLDSSLDPGPIDHDLLRSTISQRLSSGSSEPATLAADVLTDETKSLEFEILALQLSLESGRYSFMTMFIQRILNVSKDAQILSLEASSLVKHKAPFEILPQVYLPHDLWLNRDVNIPNATDKISLLRDANVLLQSYISVLQADELFLVDDRKLTEFEQRASPYCFIDLSEPKPSKRALTPVESSNLTDDPEQKDAQLSLAAQKTRHLQGLEPQTPHSLNSTAINRMPSFQREYNKPKRKHSFLGHISLSPGPQYFDSISQTSPSPLLSPLSSNVTVLSPTRPPSQSFFSKSKLYSKMKKRRELQTLVLSTSTSGTTGMASARPESTVSDYSSVFDINEAIMVERYIENQKQKHAYYVQVRVVRESVKQLVNYLRRPGILASLIKLLDFVKTYVFKIIVVDVCRMVLNYGHAKVVESSK